MCLCYVCMCVRMYVDMRVGPGRESVIAAFEGYEFSTIQL
jgi:hypothetical protein